MDQARASEELIRAQSLYLAAAAVQSKEGGHAYRRWTDQLTKAANGNTRKNQH